MTAADWRDWYEDNVLYYVGFLPPIFGIPILLVTALIFGLIAAVILPIRKWP